MPTPQALASAVASGEVDAAITTRNAAEALGLDWRPLSKAKLYIGWTEDHAELGREVLNEFLRRGG